MVRGRFENVLVLGIGGSALGPMAVFQALCHLRHNELKRNQRKAPKFYVEDNVDPERMKSLFDILDLDRTVFNVITKSGSTSETMSQYLIIMNILKPATSSTVFPAQQGIWNPSSAWWKKDATAVMC